MLQDLLEKKFYNEFNKKRNALPTDELIVFFNNEILVKGDGVTTPLSYPKVLNTPSSLLKYLFSIDEKAYFAYLGEKLELDGFSYQPTKVLRTSFPQDVCFAGFTAIHLINWYRKNKYCGCCGGKFSDKEDERALICECGNIVYPTISPAIIVAVLHEDEILVTRYKDRPYRGLALVAGFCEIGETLESTVIRELKEETGLEAEDIRYFGSQPWGHDGVLLMGFIAKAKGELTIKRDDKELAEAYFATKDEIDIEGPIISLGKTILSEFVKGNIK